MSDENGQPTSGHTDMPYALNRIWTVHLASVFYMLINKTGNTLRQTLTYIHTANMDVTTLKGISKVKSVVSTIHIISKRMCYNVEYYVFSHTDS